MRHTYSKRRLAVAGLILYLLVAVFPTSTFAENQYHHPFGKIWVDINNTSGIEDGSWLHPFTKVTAGLAEAESGQTVRVRAGIYYEHFTMKRGVKIIGEGVGKTIIDGQNANWTSRIIGGREVPRWDKQSPINKTPVIVGTNDSLLKGFTIRRGVTDNGAGILIDGTSPTIEDVLFTQNQNGIIIKNGGSPIITRVESSENLQNGLCISGAGASRISNIDILNNGNNGIAFSRGSNVSGWTGQDSKHFIEKGNIKFNGANGVQIGYTLATIQKLNIQYNVESGVRIEEYGSPFITKNDISKNLTFGIYSSPVGVQTYLNSKTYQNLDDAGTRNPILEKNRVYDNAIKDLVGITQTKARAPKRNRSKQKGKIMPATKTSSYYTFPIPAGV